MASLSKSSRRGDNGVLDYKDRISNLPMVLIDKILGHLTIFEKAKISVLSKQWRHNWSCVNSIVIDRNFWEKLCKKDGKLDLKKGSIIISSILFCHNGPIHEFSLVVPKNDVGCEETLNLSPWLCFLSRNGVKQIALTNLNHTYMTLPSSIFLCIELVELYLDKFIMNPPPAEFERFQHLQKLQLLRVIPKNDNGESLIIAKHFVINAPRLESLWIFGKIQFLTLVKVPKLRRLGLWLENKSLSNQFNTNIVDEFVNLVTSAPLVQLVLAGDSSYKTLVAGGIMNSFPLPFTHLNELGLQNLELGDFGVISITCGLIKSCTSIKKLWISVTPSKKMDVEHNMTFDNNYKLEQLHTVNFTGLTGSRTELQLIEYLLHTSTALVNLFVTLGKLDATSEVKLQRELNAFRRTSPKAQIVCLEK